MTYEELALSGADEKELAIHWLEIYKDSIDSPVIKSYLDMAISALKDSRPKGKWIRNGAHAFAPVYRCSNCNKRVAIIWGEEYKCCPNCFADMRGDTKSFYDKITEELVEGWDTPADMRGEE